MLACPACGTLVHAAELKQLAAMATAKEAQGYLAGARDDWQKVLDLLPPHAEQRPTIDAKLADLESRIAAAADSPASKVKDGRPWYRRGVATLVAVATLILGQAKFLLLGLGKATTLWSMVVFASLYFKTWGWQLVAGFVLSIYIHEMGHVYQMKRYGITASAPMFVPGLGAFVMAQQRYRDPHMDAKIGLAGPLWGLGAGAVAYAAFLYTGNSYWGAIARITAFLNLLNLVPVWQLDGMRGFHGLNRWMRWSIAAAFFVAAFLTSARPLMVVGAIAVYQALQPAIKEADYDAFGTFLLLIGALTWLAVLDVKVM